MTMQSVPDVELTSIAIPACDRQVPVGFVTALKRVSKFAGRSNMIFPWVQYVYLVDGRLYASDNRCVVEIDLGDPSFGPARFSAGDVSVLSTMGSDPQQARFSDGEVAFAWEGGQWCVFRSDLKGLQLVEKSRVLLDQFWQKGRELSSDTRKAMLDVVRKRESTDTPRFKASATGLPDDYFWHYGAISKVLAVAERFDAASIPNSFTFTNGRGLIVQPSHHSISR